MSDAELKKDEVELKASSDSSAVPPVEPKSGEQIVFPDMESFKGRLDRGVKSELKRIFGTADAEAIKAKLSQSDEVMRAEEERRKEQMSEVERLKAENEEVKREADMLRRKVKDSDFKTELLEACAAHGIRNTKIARFYVQDKQDSAEDGVIIDPLEVCESLAKDESMHGVLGIKKETPREEPVSGDEQGQQAKEETAVPFTSVPNPKAQPAPKTAENGQSQKGPLNFMTMPGDEAAQKMAEYERSLGIN